MLEFGSICSGIESASVGLEPLGFKAAWFSEIEPFPCALLKYRFPNIVNYGDMNLLPLLISMGLVSAPPYLVGGTPCQAFSVAGKRESLNDARGNLTLKYVEIINAIDNARTTPTVAIWENVPGVLSTGDNAFGCFLGKLAGSGCELQPGERPEMGKPNDFWRWDKKQKIHIARWPHAGSVHGPQRSIAWRVVDAQYFGLAQRRKRVFLVASARKDFNPEAVLFEYEGVRRDTPPSRETRENITGALKNGSHWDDVRNAHPTLDQTFNTGGIGSCNQEIFSQRGAGIVGYRMVAFGEYTVDETASTMKARDYKDATDLVVHGTQDPCVSDNLAFTLGCNGGGENAVCTDMVRRLTPIECERLQGFPDNWTLLPFGVAQKLDDELKRYYESHLGRLLTTDEYKGLCGDGARYKALGNSKATKCVRWLGIRLLLHEYGLI